MIGMLRILDRFQEMIISSLTPAILGRTCPFAFDTDRIILPGLKRQDLLDQDRMIPGITKIIFI
jgi:hypothetical protein